MQVISIQNIQDRPIIDAIAPQDFLLIGDASDGNQVKRVLVSSLTSYIISVLPDSGGEPAMQSLFLASQSPVLNDQNDSLTYELGQQLQFAKAGQITAIRYYKATSETGTHVGRIWASDGTLLASVTFVDETEAGWQEQQLDTSLAVEASTSYLVSVNVNEYYVATNFNPPQTFARGDISGSSSGFFGETGVYPTASFNNNYFRDVVFETD